MENYNILHLIGQGSFGKVFKASEISTQNVVALKILVKVNKNVNFSKMFLKYYFFSAEDQRKNYWH
jgi:serine/threonine protein kinase